MDKNMKLFNVEFMGMHPVGNCLVIAAESSEAAYKRATELVTWSDVSIEEIKLTDKTQTIAFVDGEY